MFVSPTEPATLLKYLTGYVSAMLPEEYGVDFLWESKLGLVGVQRKAFPGDFLASVEDGRLNKEYSQMKGLDVAVLLLEGEVRWTNEGNLIRDRGGKRTAWTINQHRAYLSSVQFRGIQVHSSRDHADTANFLANLRRWSNKEHHRGLDHRPAAKATEAWASTSNEDYLRYLYSSLPGINVVLAEAIREHLGLIFDLKVGREELMEVPGIGPGRADKILKVFRRMN